LSYSSRLPNFRCNRETHRLTAPLKNAERFSQTDTFIEELTYESPKETYRTLEVNGQKSSMQRDALKGVHSRGEFGSMLKSIFGPEAAAMAACSSTKIAGWCAASYCKAAACRRTSGCSRPLFAGIRNGAHCG
jgi:hypothetical protein